MLKLLGGRLCSGCANLPATKYIAELFSLITSSLFHLTLPLQLCSQFDVRYRQGYPFRDRDCQLFPFLNHLPRSYSNMQYPQQLPLSAHRYT